MNKRVMIITMSLFLCGAYANAFAQSSTTNPDNTGVNVGDRSNSAITADSQSNSKSDVKLTARIRRAVMRDKALSMMAHNVKIVTMNGQVTLVGPVKTEAEKETIASKAETIAGAGKVDNQLQVAAQ
ncbi:MAG: BON domain-containing protein [Candidatus Binataceae bacterium]